jgi:hypothetical protein
MTTSKQARRAVTALERRVAEEIGGRRTPLSGAGDLKADVVVRMQVTEADDGTPKYSGTPIRLESKSTGGPKYVMDAGIYNKAVDADPAAVTVLHIKIRGSEWAVASYDVFGPLLGLELSQLRTDARSFTLKPYALGKLEYERQKRPCMRIGLLHGSYIHRRFDVLIMPWPLFLNARTLLG